MHPCSTLSPCTSTALSAFALASLLLLCPSPTAFASGVPLPRLFSFPPTSCSAVASGLPSPPHNSFAFGSPYMLSSSPLLFAFGYSIISIETIYNLQSIKTTLVLPSLKLRDMHWLYLFFCSPPPHSFVSSYLLLFLAFPLGQV